MGTLEFLDGCTSQQLRTCSTGAHCHHHQGCTATHSHHLKRNASVHRKHSADGKQPTHFNEGGRGEALPTLMVPSIRSWLGGRNKRGVFISTCGCGGCAAKAASRAEYARGRGGCRRHSKARAAYEKRLSMRSDGKTAREKKYTDDQSQHHIEQKKSDMTKKGLAIPLLDHLSFGWASRPKK